MTEEPSVLDYLKSLLTPWKRTPLKIPAPEAKPERPPERERRAVALPWRSLLALVLALAAQRTLEPPARAIVPGVALYLLAAAWLVWASWRGEWVAASLPEEKDLPETFVVNRYALLLGFLMALLAYLSFGGNRFTTVNVTLWVAAVVFVVWAFWRPLRREKPWWQRARTFLSRSSWKLTVSPWTLLLLGAVLLSIFFRVYRLASVPPEMVSDHAEKLLDISDILNGQTSVFFSRNSGREAFQMYLTAAIVLVLRTGLTFISLKIGMVLCGLLTLPYIYLLGKEVGNRRVGLWAMAFAGIAYWPNVLSRIALRLTLSPMFVAPTLYYLIRGLRTRRRNDFILSGLFLGISLHGYSASRVVPLVVVVAIVLYFLHHLSKGARRQAGYGAWALLVVGLVSLIVFIPLLRYMVENPALFSYRVLTRMGTLERPLPAPALQIFLGNLWNALKMFSWDDGEVWVISVTRRPVLDLVSGALFHLGAALLVVRYVRRRQWQDLLLLVSIPLLMLPSILSLAFPAENPSPSRAGAALVPVFIIVGIALDGLMSAFQSQTRSTLRSGIAWALGILLLFWSSAQNYDLVFRQYQSIYELSSWNTSDMGRIIRAFADSVGSADSAWLVGYPYWADSRLVGVNAGYPTRDYAIWPDGFAATVEDPRAKLFLLHPMDAADVEALRQLYPEGVLRQYTSQIEGKSFNLFFVPPRE